MKIFSLFISSLLIVSCAISTGLDTKPTGARNLSSTGRIRHCQRYADIPEYAENPIAPSNAGDLEDLIGFYSTSSFDKERYIKNRRLSYEKVIKMALSPEPPAFVEEIAKRKKISPKIVADDIYKGMISAGTKHSKAVDNRIKAEAELVGARYSTSKALNDIMKNRGINLDDAKRIFGFEPQDQNEKRFSDDVVRFFSEDQTEHEIRKNNLESSRVAASDEFEKIMLKISGTKQYGDDEMRMLIADWSLSFCDLQIGVQPPIHEQESFSQPAQ